MQNEVDFSSGNRARRMHIVQAPSWKAKDRTDDLFLHYGDYIDSPDVRTILTVINQQEAANA